VTTTLASQAWLPGAGAPAKLAVAATIVVTFVYVAALILSFWLPEPDTAGFAE
jgi:hypothetical protein